MHQPPLQLHMRPLPRNKVALILTTARAPAATRTEMSFAQARKLVAVLGEPGNHWSEDAWLVRRSPDGRSVRLTFYRQVWGFDRTASVELTDDDTRCLATELSRCLLQVDRIAHRPSSAGPLVRLRRFMSLHHI